MTPQQRKAEFDRLYLSIPATKNTERISAVCSILYCKPNTVRIWSMKNPPRIITEKDLNVLRDGISRLKKQ